VLNRPRHVRRGGVSSESVYHNPTTGETLHVHDVFRPSGAQIPNHPTFRDYGKGS
jgi:S-adenosylmethionine hydrolase